VAYYVDGLGFGINWENRPYPQSPLYMEIERDGLYLHLSEHAGDMVKVACHAYIDNLPILVEEWRARRPGLVGEVEETPWNALTVGLGDPFGNHLQLQQNLPAKGRQEAQRTIPTFRVHSYDEAIAYYVEWLGFVVDWEWRHEPGFPVYMQISRDGLGLHLSEHPHPAFGATCLMRVRDVGALVSEWRDRDAEFGGEAESMPWGALVVAFDDPGGNNLRFQQSIDVGTHA